jgi:hypothetical protein
MKRLIRDAIKIKPPTHGGGLRKQKTKNDLLDNARRAGLFAFNKCA